MSGRPTIAWIDAQALRGNFARIRASVPPGVAILAAVKADAYGHGASLVAPVLAAAGADLFGVATVAEGVELREAGVAQPIVVLAGAARDEVAEAAARGLSVAVFDARLTRDLAAALGERALNVHVKLDTGMTRLGALPEDLPALIEALRECPRLHVEGVFSHFGDADSVGTPFADRQVRVFRDGVDSLRAAGFSPRWVHLANSVATLTRPDSFGNLVRPGIVLYGVPPAAAEDGEWRQVMHLRTRVWQVKAVPAECPVSYGQTFVTRRPSRIAVPARRLRRRLRPAALQSRPGVDPRAPRADRRPRLHGPHDGRRHRRAPGRRRRRGGLVGRPGIGQPVGDRGRRMAGLDRLRGVDARRQARSESSHGVGVTWQESSERW